MAATRRLSALCVINTGVTFGRSLAKAFVELWGLPSMIAAIRDCRLA